MLSNFPEDRPKEAPNRLTYIDLFAGCGGLSLGLQQAGWEGMFAVERSPMAFETLRYNLIDSQPTHFPHWPEWLPKEPCSIQQLTGKYAAKLHELRGKVMLIAGGPPCQGFSHAGRRQKDDHRNKLYRSYIKVVQIVRPALVLLENVVGITCEFGEKRKRGPGRPQVPYSERIKHRLAQLGYRTFDDEVLASNFGVPQNRTRFVAVGVDVAQFKRCPIITPFQVLNRLIRDDLLKEKKLPINVPVTCTDALSDLTHDPALLAECPDTRKYHSGLYGEAKSCYQRLMRGSVRAGEVADSHRFVKHTQPITARFKSILEECPRGKGIPDTFRLAHGIKKACVIPLDPDQPAPTLTTIPDDMIHYSQPRVLTVRESARLQSFPDWFVFKSKYTTGGKRRKIECPRYTQVANAVPPLLGEALGSALMWWIETIKTGICKAALAADNASADAQPSAG